MKSYKNGNLLLTILGLSLLTACQKEAVEQGVDSLCTQEKFQNRDPRALTGDWETDKIITWDWNDSATVSYEKMNLTISNEYWTTEEFSVPYSFAFPIICNIITRNLTFHSDTGDAVIPFFDYYLPDGQIRFYIYEYPKNSAVFRIDKHYVLKKSNCD